MSPFKNALVKESFLHLKPYLKKTLSIVWILLLSDLLFYCSSYHCFLQAVVFTNKLSLHNRTYHQITERHIWWLNEGFGRDPIELIRKTSVKHKNDYLSKSLYFRVLPELRYCDHNWQIFMYWLIFSLFFIRTESKKTKRWEFLCPPCMLLLLLFQNNKCWLNCPPPCLSAPSPTTLLLLPPATWVIKGLVIKSGLVLHAFIWNATVDKLPITPGTS